MSGIESDAGGPCPEDALQPVRWATVDPQFGSAMPHGSCNAVQDDGLVCGFPRRADGTCLNGHPAAVKHRPRILRQEPVPEETLARVAEQAQAFEELRAIEDRLDAEVDAQCQCLRPFDRSPGSHHALHCPNWREE